MSTFDPKAKSDKSPPPSAFQPVKKLKLECGMDGYVKMVKEILGLVLILATFANETFKAMLPKNLQLSATYAYDFIMGAGAWLGYAVAALYFFSVEYDFGDQVCEASAYGYEAIDALQVLVNFTDSTKAKPTA